MNGIVLKVLSWVLPMVLGPLVYVGARQLLNLSTKIDDLPASVKRIVVVIVGVLVSSGLAALGVTVPAECSVLSDVHATSATAQACFEVLTTKVPVQGVVSALVAMIIHAAKKSSPRS